MVLANLSPSITIALVLLAVVAACTPKDSSPKTEDQYHSASPTLERETYDSSLNMYRIFSGPGHLPETTHMALNEARLHRDVSQVPIIIEILRFFVTKEFVIAANLALNSLTDQTIPPSSDEWNKWMIWVGQNRSDYTPPEGYVEWKITLLESIDTRFAKLLSSAEETSRIDLTEVVWGGVQVDGIPDLRNSPVVKAIEEDYLFDDDAVFGVSINGEHRAYPLRILNPHEMANDTLGGEPITLTY